MVKRNVNRAGFVEAQWKPFLEKLESNRVRRAKTAARQGWVRGLAVGRRCVAASVHAGSMHRDGFHVKMPVVDWWEPYQEQVALWLSRRPDWLAALYAGEWDSEWLEFLDGTGLRLFPDASFVQRCREQAMCSCPELDPLCWHVVAVAYAMIYDVQRVPLRALVYAGLSIPKVLELAHDLVRTGGERSVETGHEWRGSGVLALWPEEQAVYAELAAEPTPGIHRCIVPEVEPDRLSQWKAIYMAWA